MHTNPTQAACDMKTVNYGQKERRDWGKNARKMEKPSHRRTTGKWEADKLQTESGKRKMQPGDNAENGQNKDDATKEDSRNRPSRETHSKKMERKSGQRRGDGRTRTRKIPQVQT